MNLIEIILVNIAALLFVLSFGLYIYIVHIKLRIPLTTYILKAINFFKYPIWILSFTLDFIHYLFNKKKYLNCESHGKFKPSKKILLLVMVSTRLSAYPSKKLIAFFQKLGYQVIPIVNGILNTEDVLVPFMKSNNIDYLINKPNNGYDFGCYKVFFENEKKADLNYIEDLIVLNDSVLFLDINHSKFEKWLKDDTPFKGGVFNYGDEPAHMQSFFMQFKKNGISLFGTFLKNYLPLSNRVYAIRKGEQALTSFFMKNKIIPNAYIDLSHLAETDQKLNLILFHSIFYYNSTHRAPIDLIKLGFPFLKTDIVSKKINPHDSLMFLKTYLPKEDLKEAFYYFQHILKFRPIGKLTKFLQFVGLR